MISVEERSARARVIGTILSGIEIIDAIGILCLCVTTLWGMDGCRISLLTRIHGLVDELADLERKQHD